MKVVNESNTLKNDKPAISVKTVIDQLIRVILYNSIKKGIFIINDISPDLKSNCDVNILALVFGNLIKDAISYSEDDCLRLSSSENGEIAIGSRKSNLAKNRSFMVGVDSLQVIAERLGSGISISSSFNNGIEIFVRFNKKAA